jgi:hypothetical protein
MFYDDCLEICQRYIKEDPKRFLDRQIEYHLNKSPQQLVAADKEILANWLKISSGLIIGKDKASEFMNKILSLKEESSK